MRGRSPSFRTDKERVEDYAESMEMNASYYGSGANGDAFLTDKNTIIKITGDPAELEIAKKLVGKTFSNVVNIFAVENDMIHMEFVNVYGIEDLYAEVREYGEEIDLIDLDDHENISEEALKFINDISYGIHELAQNGIKNWDISEDNIGQKSDGNYAMFDISDYRARFF